jgi:phospholipid N-methyltransferase
MTEQNGEFYRDLGQDKYLTEVKRFVPGYDQMTKVVANLVIESIPSHVLDIGSGVGNVDSVILSSLGNVRMTCLESAEPMVRATETFLRKYESRVHIVNDRVQDFRFNETYDCAFSNLVLHNIPHNEKGDVLVEIRNSLEDGAPFIWGDLIRYNSLKQKLLVGYRHALAFQKGSSFNLVLKDWRKERHDDTKLSLEETISLCKRVGFQKPRLVWKKTRGTTGVFYMRK